jgi:uncharacterized protein RhaS with RHS repeats
MGQRDIPDTLVGWSHEYLLEDNTKAVRDYYSLGRSETSGAVAASASNDSMFGAPLTIADPLSNTTSINNDTYGNATRVTDPSGHQATFGYNGGGLL